MIKLIDVCKWAVSMLESFRILFCLELVRLTTPDTPETCTNVLTCSDLFTSIKKTSCGSFNLAGVIRDFRTSNVNLELQTLPSSLRSLQS